MGRFDMLSLHTYLFARRMKHEGTDVALSLGQEVFDLFVYDVERALREIGIGDTSVPKKKKKMIRSFYGQIEDFDTPLHEHDLKQLSVKVVNRFHGNENDKNNGTALASYMLEIDKELQGIPYGQIAAGDFKWPETGDIKN